ncbi:MAG TPA: tetratricopeptide repeat protein [Acidobacteriota bacterium]|nr:tetratricopeptide repeat protein [Acidobacteriota bacterium]
MLLVASMAVSALGQVQWIEKFDRARELAQAGDKFIVLDLSADWCPPCVKMDREVYPDPGFIEFSRSQVYMLLDAYKTSEGEWLRRKFHVEVFPTILVLDSQGQEIDRLTGGRTVEGLIEDLEAIFELPIPAKELNARADAQPQDLELQLTAGKRALDRDDFKNALRYLDRVLQGVSLDSPELLGQALPMHSRAAFEAGDYQGSLDSLDKMVELIPSLADRHWLLQQRAQCLMALERHDEAFEVVDNMLRTASGEDRDEAAELYQQLPKKFRKADEEASKLTEKAQKKLDKGQIEEGLDLAREALRTSPIPEARMTVAVAHFMMAERSKDEDASRHYEEGLHQLRLCRLLDFHGMKTFTDSKSLLASQHVRYAPKDEEARKKYGRAEENFAKGRLRDAANLYLEVTKIEPDFAKAYLHLGDCFFQSKQFDQALACYLEAVKHAPLDASTYRFAASALGKLERADEAYEMVVSSLLADPEYPMVWAELRQWAQATDKPYETHRDVVPPHLLTLRPQDNYEGLFSNLAPQTVPAWRQYVNCKLRWRSETFAAKNPGAPYYRPTAQEEVECLQAAADRWEEMRLEDPQLMSDDRLDFILQVAIDGRLKAFVLLELYGEMYRHELEAWKQPDRRGLVKAYLDDYVFGAAQMQARMGFNSSAIRNINAGVEVHESHPQQAAEFYRLALRHEPGMTNAAANLTQVLYRLEEYSEAEETARRWMKLAPDSSRPYDLLSLVLARQERFQEAAEVLEKGIPLETDLSEKQRLVQNLEVFRSRVP